MNELPNMKENKSYLSNGSDLNVSVDKKPEIQFTSAEMKKAT